MLQHRLEAAFPGLGDAFQFRFLGRAVFAGFKVDRLLDLFLGVRLEPVKAALALAARIAVADHPFDQFGFAEDLMERILFGQRLGHAAEHVRHQVEADHVEQSEHPGLGDAQGPADDGVRFLDADLHIHRPDDAALQPVDTDPVGDEARRVLARNDGLAEPEIGEPVDRIDGVGAGAFAGHHLQKPEIPWRVEEMGDQEVGLEILGHALGQPGKGNGRGVGGHDRARLAGGLDFFVKGLFEVEPFDDRLDDPVAIGNQAHIVVDVAGGDQMGAQFVHQRRRVGLEQLFHRPFGDGASVVAVLGGDIEQHHRHAGIGDLRRDPGAHDAGAENGGFFDLGHFVASRTVAIP